VADPKNVQPEVKLKWQEPIRISRIVIEFDPDWDHPMESVLFNHSEEAI